MKYARIARLAHRVILASMHDVVTHNGEMRLAREAVWRGWAAIEPKRSTMFAKTGYAIDENRKSQSHIITMRRRYDFDISAAAWVMEERLKSSSRWFKVLGVLDDSDEYVKLSCRLYERGEDVTKPVEEAPDKPSILTPQGLPAGVRL